MPELYSGSRLGPYEILAPLGQGGMGQVYRARDTRLGRDVAIKVSSERFSERFEREARVIASLNHANICTLFDIGSTPDIPGYLVMELIDGATLGERIAEGPVPVEDALSIAKQIAAALGEAHERGIIHRDLKPANVKLVPGGSVKVLDFGLAKIEQPQVSSTSGSPAESPTLTFNATQAGMILGTAAYMSPEQARGKPVDKRTDIWAFGVVLYEMVTAKHPFEGGGITDTLAAVIMKDPDFEIVPLRFRRLVRHCLQKDPHKRLRDISSVTLLLDDDTLSGPISGSGPVPVPPPLPSGAQPVPAGSRLQSFNWKWPAIAAIATALLWFVFGDREGEQRVAPTVARLTMDLAPAEMLRPFFYDRPARTAFAISPDGSTIVFTGHDGNIAHLYKRALADERATMVEDTEWADYPFFSPDGRWIGFAQENKLRKVAMAGGPPVDIAEIGNRIEGASWGDGIIVYRGADGIMQVPDAGGTPELILEPNSNVLVVGRNTPLILPDNDTILFTDNNDADWSKARIVAMDLSSKRQRTVIENAADPRYWPGYLTFLRGTDLMAVRFNPDDPDDVIGSPVPLVGNIMRAINAPNGSAETGMGQYAVSRNGTLVYAPGGIFPIPDTDLVRVNRTGIETKIAAVKGALFDLRASPDGNRLVAINTLNGSRAGSLLLFDLAAGGTSVRLTQDGARSQSLWQGNDRIVYNGADGAKALTVNSGAAPEPLKDAEGAGTLLSLSRDGQWLARLESGSIMARALDGSSPARRVGPEGAMDAEFSPDGKWIAYRSAESGQAEVYVEPFPGPGAKRRVSTTGGTNPAWSANGRELFYFVPGNRSQMMAVTISAEGVPGTPRMLFSGAFAVTTPTRSYDVTPSGDFILAHPSGGEPIDQRVTKLNVVLGWGEEVRQRLSER